MIDVEHLEKYGYARIDAVIDPHQMELMLASARAAFDLPPDTKAKYQRTGGGYGYTPPGVERVVGNTPDLNREFWDIGQGSPNIFPDEIDGFGSSAMQLHTQLIIPRNRTSVVLFTQPRPEIRLPNGQSTSDYISNFMTRVREE